MKKIFSLIAAFALLTGCDDGDMTYKTFDFTGKTVNTCTIAADATTVKYYQLNGPEGLILQLSATALKNESTFDPILKKHIPYIIDISSTGTNTITYKNYGTTAIAQQSVCSTIADDGAETWKGEGKLSVVTEVVTDKDTGKITSYSHVITMQNISFSKGDETIIINNNVFGQIDKQLGFNFDFVIGTSEEPKLEKCTNTNLLYTLKGSEVLSLDINDYAAAFNFEGTSLELPIADVNELTFTVVGSTLTSDAVCGEGAGGGPVITIKQKWKATAGTLRIKKEQVLGEFVYSFYLVDVVFRNSITLETFNLNDIAVLNTTENAYYFGKKFQD